MLELIKNFLKIIPGMKWLAKKSGFVSEPIDERLFLFEYFDKSSVGAEIGVWEGDFSLKILNIVSPSKLYLIDPWKFEGSSIYKDAGYGRKFSKGQNSMDKRFNKVRKLFKKSIDNGTVIILRGNSASELEKIENNSLDWVYIDANHLYEFVKEDLENSFIKVKTNGYIIGDDYFEGGWWQGGVKKAVDEFLTNKKVELIKIDKRQYVLKKISN